MRDGAGGHGSWWAHVGFEAGGRWGWWVVKASGGMA